MPSNKARSPPTPTTSRTTPTTSPNRRAPSPPLQADILIKEKLYGDFDYFGDLVLCSDGHDRIAYWNHFEALYELFEHKEARHGRIRNRRDVCRLLVIVTVAKLIADGDFPYEGDDDDGELFCTSVRGKIPLRSIVQWTEGDWDQFQSYLLKIANNLLRRDADDRASQDPNEDPDEERKSERPFNDGLEKMLRTIKVLRGVSPFQDRFSELLKNEDRDYPPDAVLDVDEDLIQDFWEKAQTEPHDYVRRVFQGILQKPSPDGRTQLMPINKLIQQLKTKPLSLDHFYYRLNRTVNMWADSTFGQAEELDHDPEYGGGRHYPRFAVVSSSPLKEVRRLRAARNALSDGVGVDPLDESYAVAASAAGVAGNARGSRRQKQRPEDSGQSPLRRRSAGRPSSANKRKRDVGGSLYERKKSASRIGFDDDEEKKDSEYKDGEIEDIDSDDDDSAAAASSRKRRGLTDLPKRRRSAGSTGSRSARPSQVKKYEGRRVWTNEEKRAIIEGMKRFGVGKWAMIKEEYHFILDNRTSGQIKDCYRTMKRRGELPDDIDDEEGAGAA